MADNSSIPVASGNETFANKDIAGVKYPRHIQVDGTGAEIAPATQTTLAAVLAKIIAAPATEAKQDTGNTSLAAIAGSVDGIEALVGATNTALAGVSTEVTLADVKTAVEALAALIAGGALNVFIDPSSVNANGQATMANSAPVVIASDQSAVKVTPGVSATANGATPSRINAAASTNATSLKASAGQIYSIDVYNPAAYTVFLKLYNKASAPTVGTDTPVMTIPIAAGGGYSKTWPMGFPFSTGIAYAITKLQADSDTTVVVAGDLTGNAIWI